MRDRAAAASASAPDSQVTPPVPLRVVEDARSRRVPKALVGGLLLLAVAGVGAARFAAISPADQGGWRGWVVDKVDYIDGVFHFDQDPQFRGTGARMLVHLDPTLSRRTTRDAAVYLAAHSGHVAERLRWSFALAQTDVRYEPLFLASVRAALRGNRPSARVYAHRWAMRLPRTKPLRREVADLYVSDVAVRRYGRDRAFALGLAIASTPLLLNDAGVALARRHPHQALRLLTKAHAAAPSTRVIASNLAAQEKLVALLARDRCAQARANRSLDALGSVPVRLRRLRDAGFRGRTC
jgi:hypothetical protein